MNEEGWWVKLPERAAEGLITTIPLRKTQTPQSAATSGGLGLALIISKGLSTTFCNSKNEHF
jgi:hypothetical protein